MGTKLLLLSFLALCIAGAVQKPLEQMALADSSTLSVEVDRVNVVFSVTNGRGRLITNLQQGDFKVFEDGRPQPITNFSSETDLPLSLGLLIDTSGSIRDKIGFEREA